MRNLIYSFPVAFDERLVCNSVSALAVLPVTTIEPKAKIKPNSAIRQIFKILTDSNQHFSKIFPRNLGTVEEVSHCPACTPTWPRRAGYVISYLSPRRPFARARIPLVHSLQISIYQIPKVELDSIVDE